MSNILVLKNYTIKDHTKWYNDRSNEVNLKENYNQMEKVCTSSAKQCLQNLDDIIVTRGQEENIRDVFRSHFKEIYDIWREGHNILYTDLDVIFRKPVNIFGEFEHFAMFNYTDPRQTKCNHYNVELPHFFNCGIRYYPKDMSKEIWDLGFQLLDNWNPDRWDTEQVIYNLMMWNQAISLNDIYKPELAYQFLTGDINRNNQFNCIQLQDASIIHVHGSRGSTDRVALMKQLLEL